ncbi:MAG: hypothetical protein ACPGVB_08735 [Chitinophagales bacterium]
MMTAEQRTKAFNAIDTSNNGTIGFGEWYAHFKGWADENSMSEAELEMMFAAYDEAGSSRGVDITEYNSFMDDVFGSTVSNDSADGRKASFDTIDKDGSGLINFIEWYKHFKGLLADTDMTRGELEMMFSAYDEGGSVRGVDLEEYTNFMNDVFGEAK